MKKNLKIIKALFRLRFHNILMFRLGFWGPFFVDGSLFIIQLFVFQAVYSNIDRIGTWGKGEMVIFIGTFSLINAFNMIFYFFGINDIPDKIKTGEMDLYLTKPVSPLLRFTFEKINPGSFPLLILSIFIISYGVRTSKLHLGMGNAGRYVLSVLLMTILWYEMEVIIRSLSFFFISTANVTRIEEASIDLCMKVPGIALKGIYRLLFYYILPYGVMATFPTLTLTGKASPSVWLWGTGSVVLFGVLAGMLWKRGLRHYNSVSS